MAVDQVLKKNFWAVLLALVAVVAFLNANGIMQLVGASLAPDDKQLSAASPLARATASAWMKASTLSVSAYISAGPPMAKRV